MNNPNSSYPPAQQQGFERHRSQVWWQIVLPVLLFALGMIALAILTTLAGNTTVIRWSDISLILLILPTAVIGFVVLILFGLLIFLTSRIIGALPHYAGVAQHFLNSATAFLNSLSDKAASPVISIESTLAGIRTLFKSEPQS